MFTILKKLHFSKIDTTEEKDLFSINGAVCRTLIAIAKYMYHGAKMFFFSADCHFQVWPEIAFWDPLKLQQCVTQT